MSNSPAPRTDGHSVTLRRRSVYAITAAAVAAGSLSVTVTAFAKDGGGKDARSTVACGSGGELELRAKPDDGGTEVKVKVRRRATGERWLVTLKDNGKVRWSQTRTTSGSSGSFEIETLLMPGDGTTPTSTSTTSTGSSTSSTSTTSSGTSTTSSGTSSTTSPGTSTTSPGTSTTSPGTSTTSSGATTTSSGTGTSTASPTTDDHGGDRLRAPAAAAGSDHTIQVIAVHDSLTCSTAVRL